MDLPVTFAHTFCGEYGWISVFIIETQKYLGLRDDELPSKTPKLIPMLVEKAAGGLVEEGAKLGKTREAEVMASMLTEGKNETMENVWTRCAYLYTLESFLYKQLNMAMRLVGDKRNENTWKSKIPTLGPFCLLFWDDPFNRGLCLNKVLYRGAELTQEQIDKYRDASNNKDEYGSFQAFSSCTRNRQKADQFANSLFILNIEFAFVTDLSQFSQYPDEEEEIITPGVCFRVQSVEFDSRNHKHIIYLILRQRFSGEYDDCLQC